jgi:hypothetical protein
MRKSVVLSVAIAFLAIAVSGSATQSAASVGIATVPMVLEMNRPYVDFTLTAANGNPVQARFWLDTGGGAILLSAGLAKRLGLKPKGKAFHSDGSQMAETDVPQFRVGGLTLKLAEPDAYILVDSAERVGGTDAQGAMPLRMLSQYHVVFDYPKRTFTVAEAGKLKSEGTEVKSWIGKVGMPVVTLKLDDTEHHFLLDTGGTYCMMSAALLDSLEKRHADWTQVQGAYGPANMLLGKKEPDLKMLRIGAMQWGNYTLVNTGAVSRPAGVYENWMSQIAGHPLEGSIGGNALQWFRVDIDYPAGKVFLAGKPQIPAELDMVGIIIERDEGGYVIVATAPGVTAVHVGDRLLRVDSLVLRGTPLATIMHALSGKVGESRRLEIERGGKVQDVIVPVQKIL